MPALNLTFSQALNTSVQVGDMAYVTDSGDAEWAMYVYDGVGCRCGTPRRLPLPRM